MTEHARLIPCSDAVEQLWDYLDRTLGAEDRAAVDEHLNFCRRCCGEMEFATELRSFLASQGADEIPPSARESLERFVGDL